MRSLRQVTAVALAVATAMGAGGATALSDTGTLAVAERPYSAFSSDPHRRFDFWIGLWDVTLRMRQDDLSWQDSVEARTHIYPVLDGRAILELWDSPSIKGFSLRYYDPAREKWVLWLNWPQPNQSRTTRLEGRFRHGRGTFHSEFENRDGQTVQARYSFNDITPVSLRWDDSYSVDGGKTWSENWRMEFSRRRMKPVWPIDRDDVPTYTDGSRCDEPEFDAYNGLAGDWSGTVRMDGEEHAGRLSAYRILDGCAVMAFITAGERAWFLFNTFNTARQAYESNVLSDDPDRPLLQVHGEQAGQLEGAGGVVHDWSFGEEVVWTVTVPADAEGSARALTARFGRD